MHNRLRRVIGERETERARNPGPRISLIGAVVIIHLEFEIGPSSRRGTSTQVILLILRTLMPRGTSLTPRSAMIEMPSVIESSVISVAVCMEVSAW